MGKVIDIDSRKRSEKKPESSLPAYLNRAMRDFQPKIKHLGMNWIFVLYRAPRKENEKIIVDFTMVQAPGEPEEDRKCLAPFLQGGWQPLLLRSTDDGTPMANLTCPDGPEATFREATRILPPEKRVLVLAPDVVLNYIPSLLPQKKQDA